MAICFLVRDKSQTVRKIYYARRPEDETAEDKLSWLNSAQLPSVSPVDIKPNPNGDWINQADTTEWDKLLPFASQETKSAKEKSKERAIFKLFSLGVVTSRDDWAWNKSRSDLSERIEHNIEIYNYYLKSARESKSKFDYNSVYDRGEVKWTRLLRSSLESGRTLDFDTAKLWPGMYRPFEKEWIYYDSTLNEVQYQTHRLFDGSTANPSITTMGDSTGKPYFAFAIDRVPDLNFVSPGSGGTMTFARNRIAKSGERVDNITDWGLNKFTARYGKKGVTKDAIFAYCYAVLHDPVYREKYALNLKREFPRIPFYPDFAQWVAWGEALMAMHIGYEQVNLWALERIDVPEPKRAPGTHPKPVLKSHPEKGCVVVDADTQLTGIPKEAWDYRLGNRSAIDWVLDQHKEKKPRDPTIAATFNTYRFADYKESMIDLLARVVRVSVDTVAITSAMQALDRSDWAE